MAASDPSRAPVGDPGDARQGRLHRPVPAPSAEPLARGLSELITQDGGYAGQLYLPADPPRRLVVMLHGAGGTAGEAMRLLQPYAADHLLAVYAPQAIGPTWDLVEGRFGPDTRRLQRALDRLAPVLARGGPAAIAGFSDGASYALSLGLGNGDVFDAVMAFSPGFAAPGRRVDRPRLFISHGRHDRVLPVQRCGRRLARILEADGYPLCYDEFDGGHLVPPAVIEHALRWL